MSEHPILFSTEMVQAILAGRKSQTRRVIKPQPPRPGEFRESAAPDKAIFKPGLDEWWLVPDDIEEYDPSPRILYAYKNIIKPGDVLWVKETWTYITLAENEFDPTNPVHRRKPDGYPVFMVYRADGDEIAATWSPSMFMPKWASRLRLAVTEVRLERLQDITLGGIAAEGWPDAPKEEMVWLPDLPEIQMAGFEWFIGVWDDLNVKRGFSFESNPFVKVISFKVNNC